MKHLLANPHSRKEFYDFCLEFLGEDITEIIDTREKPYPELTRVALLVKQELMTGHAALYQEMKKEINLNE